MHSTVLIVALVAAVVAFDPGRGNTILANNSEHTDPQSKLSPCVEECVVSATKASSCGTPKNVECECTNKAFQIAAFICMHSKCTPAELLEALEVGQRECAKFGLGATTHRDTNTIRIGSSPAGHIHASNFLETSTTKSQAEPPATTITVFTETQTAKLTSTASASFPTVSVTQTSTDSAHTVTYSSAASVTSESASTSAVATVGGSSSSAAGPRAVSWPVAIAVLAVLFL
ncbi:hypothetical protein C8F01DRAFT_1378111 [Mycena amicta]|nr:hypothetical protein C8F01DRAFT_1378111 [Mycena amicta]